MGRLRRLAASGSPTAGWTPACATRSCSPATCTPTGPPRSSATSPRRPAQSVGTELVCSSITSGGDGADEPTGAHPWFPQNPHLKFWNNLRGYVNTTITPQQLDADFRCVPRVTTPGLPAFTRRSYTVEDGDRRLHQTADAPSTTRTLRQRGLTPAEVSRQTLAQELAD